MEGRKFYRGHVVLVPYPAQGHINPFVQFAKRLAAKGVKATLATTHYTVKSICAANVGVEPISDGFDQGGFAQAGNADLYVQGFRVNGSRTLSELIRKYDATDYPVDCVVYDSFLPWALDVAKHHGVYGAAFFTNSATVSSVFGAIHQGLVSLPLNPEDTPLLLPGLPPLNYKDLPTFITKHMHLYPAYLAVLQSQFTNVDRADCILVNSFEALEAEQVRGASELFQGTFVGPLIPSAYLDEQIEGDKGYGSSLWKPLGKECMAWLESKKPQSVAYVSFGSMGAMSVEQMEEIALGLKESGLNFLWVVRDSEKSKLPEGFIDSTNGKGLIVSWCNQLEVLAHEAIGCFVTHCGWNSTLEGLSLGVPMVGVPQWSDQFCDAKFIEEIWKVGVWAKEDADGVVTKEELRRCLKEVVGGERSREIKQNARKWRKLAKQASSEGGSSDDNINEFVYHLKRPYQNGHAKAMEAEVKENEWRGQGHASPLLNAY